MSRHQSLLKHEAVERRQTTTFGFWIYLMTDCMLFASVFAVYIVLRHNTVGGPSISDIVELDMVLVQTVLLLASSLTSALALLFAKANHLRSAVIFLVLTGALGAGFLALEIREFAHIIHMGYDWQFSAFLSAFFVLVGLHGAHIAAGLLWLIVLIVRLAKRGLGGDSLHRIGLFTLFWHFLDIVWIFLFAIVYLLGVGGI